LMRNLTSVLRRALGRTFYPVLQQPIGFGSAFEGWTASEEEVTYRVLVPLTAPIGHIFHLERDSDQQVAGRNFRVHVSLECRCPSEEEGANILCFLHHPDVIRAVTGQPILLDTLCTGSYLDVKKTVHWFRILVRASWRRLPQSRSWNLVLLPSKRSCNFRLTNSQESFQVRVVFGVQRQHSDIFVTGRSRGAHIPSTMWPESYGVAETKFFRHMASQVPQDSSHLKCLQLFAGVLAHVDLPIHVIKTIVMHLLNTVPVAQWHARYFLLQLSDAMEQLHSSLEKKHLEHFTVGNQRLPEDIRVPSDVQRARPPNVFHSLVQDAAAHSHAVQAY
ncbi:IPIL1 protein, partial [Aegithalos caudatus]|nr:IPIL1 protein [Aegithalos caudatus]